MPEGARHGGGGHRRASLAHAEPRIERAVALDAARAVVTQTLSMTSDELNAREVTTTIDVPRGARVAGMTVTIGGMTTTAKPARAADAATQFRAMTVRKLDPARYFFLELVESTRDGDRLRLHVFPVAIASPARVEIVIELQPNRTAPARVSALMSLVAGVDVPLPRFAPELPWCAVGTLRL